METSGISRRGWPGYCEFDVDRDVEMEVRAEAGDATACDALSPPDFDIGRIPSGLDGDAASEAGGSSLPADDIRRVRSGLDGDASPETAMHPQLVQPDFDAAYARARATYGAGAANPFETFPNAIEHTIQTDVARQRGEDCAPPPRAR